MIVTGSEQRKRIDGQAFDAPVYRLKEGKA
jgi:hypothetical protein